MTDAITTFEHVPIKAANRDARRPDDGATQGARRLAAREGLPGVATAGGERR